MNVSLYQAAAAMNANSQAQDIISGNMAASVIPGFKKQNVTFSAVEAGMLSGAKGVSQAVAVMPKAAPTINFSQGELKNTGLSTDLALEGKGFFEVQLPSGALAYTRDGEFHVNAQGQIVTKQGYLLMGDNGPIQLDKSNSSPVLITENGDVNQASIARGRIKLVNFENPNLLEQINAGYYAARDPHIAPVESTASVRQGFLEGANTTPTLEMVNLISAMRAFEANQKVVQIEDERMGRAISELGNPN